MSGVRTDNNKKLMNFFSGRKFIFIVAALLGGIIFLSIFGFYVVNPLHVDWLINGGDLNTHFIGWEYFRHSPWSFPLGMIPQLAYPFGVPITYTDSIPAFAILFKIFSGILPNSFQYFGLWGLFCYMLQGGFAAMIIRRWTKNIPIILVCSLVFILSPILMQRMFVHTALASQWLILASIWAALEWRKIARTKQQIMVWSILLVLAVLIHPYFVPMVGLFFAISVVLTHRSWTITIIKVISPLFIAVSVFWAIGGFSVHEVAGAGLGEYAFNLNSLFNPLGWSKFLPALANTYASTETLNYLGLGLILLIPLSGYLFLANVKDLNYFKTLLKKINVRYLMIILFVVLLCLAAISPKVQFGTRILINIQLPLFITKVLSIFRASARLFWPIYYLIIVGLLSSVLKASRKMSIIVLCIFLSILVFIQGCDIYLSTSARATHSYFEKVENIKKEPLMDMTGWNGLVGKRKHMVYLDSMTNEEFFELVSIAMPNNLTINNGYFARTPYVRINSYIIEQRSLLSQNKANMKDNLYISKDRTFIDSLKSNSEYSIYQLNGYYIIEKTRT